MSVVSDICQGILDRQTPPSSPTKGGDEVIRAAAEGLLSSPGKRTKSNRQIAREAERGLDDQERAVESLQFGTRERKAAAAVLTTLKSAIARGDGSAEPGCVLVTGGAGYIGSHTIIVAVEAGWRVVILDNFCNASIKCVDRIEALTGYRPTVVNGDLRDKRAVEAAFSAEPGINCVIHLAGLKAVGESVQKPLMYYDNNVTGSNVLFRVMAERGVKNIVFSSSACVYGDPETLPIPEDHRLIAHNPYGQTKLVIERILKDLAESDPEWNVVILRYFNPIGAHKSGQIGEDPKGVPNNLSPYVAQVAVGKREKLTVFGNDYDTPDGTGVRDYLHIIDLADGHRAALDKLFTNPGYVVYNLGTGRGSSVLDVVAAFEKAADRKINYVFADRRDGDVASCYADPSLAEKELNWRATRDLDEMCEDLWRWQSSNPNGFED